jgi:hypothetical protein
MFTLYTFGPKTIKLGLKYEFATDRFVSGIGSVSTLENPLHYLPVNDPALPAVLTSDY